MNFPQPRWYKKEPLKEISEIKVYFSESKNLYTEITFLDSNGIIIDFINDIENILEFIELIGFDSIESFVEFHNQKTFECDFKEYLNEISRLHLHNKK